jgi:hypothetical protein
MLRAFVAGLALVGFAQQATSQTFSADELARRTIERRAVEAVIWGRHSDSPSKGRGLLVPRHSGYDSLSEGSG